MVFDININVIIEKLEDPKALALIIGFLMTIIGAAIWTVNPLWSMGLGIGGFAIILAVVAPETFKMLVRDIWKGS